MSDLFHINFNDNANNSNSEHSLEDNTAQKLWESVYSGGSETLNTLQKGADMLGEYAAKRFEENPTEATVEAIGLTAAVGLGIAAIPVESAAVTGLMIGGAVISGCGALAIEARKQCEANGIKFDGSLNNQFNPNSIYKNSVQRPNQFNPNFFTTNTNAGRR